MASAATATPSSSGMALIPAATKLTRVDWEELRYISVIVQQALDDAGADEHDEYSTVWDMWKEELKDAKSVAVDAPNDEERAPCWYSSAHDFWEDEKNCPLTDNGVLGGFAHVSPADIKGSERFLARVQKLRPGWERHLAVDCGAGIGRVSKFLLLPTFKQVDLVEQSPRLLQSVPQYVGRNSSDTKRIRNLYCMGLQDFHPEEQKYDLIWIQWVSSHLTDVDFVHFLKRCKQALAPNGWIGVKENVVLSGTPFELDREDSSITRSAAYYKSLFKQAGLTIVVEELQQHFPRELYPVKMFALA
ncbi:N-terminal xaa-pro-lys n-methyltransferase 1 isoform x1, partial [Globisporangium splendens]